MASLYHTALTQLKGVGAMRAQLFSKLGIQSVGALLRFYPRDYEDWSKPVSILSAPFNEVSIIKAQVVAPVTQVRAKGGMLLFKTTVTDGFRDLSLTFFNNKYIGNILKEGNTYLFKGKVGGTMLKREMLSPVIMKEEDAVSIKPVYPLTAGLSLNVFLKTVRQALDMLPEKVSDPIPEYIREKYNLCDLRTALFEVHFPSNEDALEKARRRLVFEELLILQLGIALLGNRQKSGNNYKIKNYEKEFYSFLPFEPTNAQKNAVSEMIEDMNDETAMCRLLQGDVGSGKTAVAAALCYCVYKSGYQSALMAPTEILAQQHYKSLSSLLSGTDAKVALLTSSVKGKERKRIIEKLACGEISLVIGTHALLTDDVVFNNLALVITDEQHRFGVNQRMKLNETGDHPHMLVMSATPIPRTLALMIYGDLSLSVLDELPKGRQKIETYAISSDKRERAYWYLRKHIDEGYQCYVICPLIEEGESDMASALEYREKLLQNKIFEGCKIETLHGKLKNKEKNEIMERFANGETDILVSTTVVEVGVDVPNAAIILIENAERYGLSQLHQLRGRVGRGNVKSTCILVSDAQNDEAISRMKVMVTSTDGFKIAEEDLRLRGPGNFFGNQQHGLPKMKIADIKADMETLRNAQNCAQEILNQDFELKNEEYKSLKGEIRLLFDSVGEYGLN